jgi:hypothetical protein
MRIARCHKTDIPSSATVKRYVERHLGATDPIVLVVGNGGSIARIEIIQCDPLGWGGDRHNSRSGFLLVGWWLGGSSGGGGRL